MRTRFEHSIRPRRQGLARLGLSNATNLTNLRSAAGGPTPRRGVESAVGRVALCSTLHESACPEQRPAHDDPDDDVVERLGAAAPLDATLGDGNQRAHHTYARASESEHAQHPPNPAHGLAHGANSYTRRERR